MKWKSRYESIVIRVIPISCHKLFEWDFSSCLRLPLLLSYQFLEIKSILLSLHILLAELDISHSNLCIDSSLWKLLQFFPRCVPDLLTFPNRIEANRIQYGRCALCWSNNIEYFYVCSYFFLIYEMESVANQRSILHFFFFLLLVGTEIVEEKKR